MTGQAYLVAARRALASQPPEPRGRERSETSETSERRYQPGGRYEVRGPLLGTIHGTTEALESWRKSMGLPRAGLMTVSGELVLIADVRAFVRTGWMDVVAIPGGGQ